MDHVEHSFTMAEVMMTIMGFALTVSFGVWAAVVKRSADNMTEGMALAVEEIKKLREEIHADRLGYEKRFAHAESDIRLIKSRLPHFGVGEEET